MSIVIVEESISSCSSILSEPITSSVSNEQSNCEPIFSEESKESSLEWELDKIYDEFVNEDKDEISENEMMYLLDEDNEDIEEWELEMDKQWDEMEEEGILKDVTNIEREDLLLQENKEK